MRGFFRTACAGLAAASVLIGPRAHAQPSQPARPAPPEAFIASQLERLALLDLRAVESPSAGDFAITEAILAIAQELAPGDTQIVRRRIEAAWNAGDNDALLDATRRIVELDPDDTVAQLRLITAKIGQVQVAQERLRLYEAFLGPKGEALDPSIRSRLALDAALLQRERGDEPGFVEKLKLAARLDSTNKDAALLVLNYFTERSGDLPGQLELLANLLYADPLDPKTHAAIRDVLASGGAFEQAARFHKNVENIYKAAGHPPEQERIVQGMVLDWYNKGPTDPVEQINKIIRIERDAVSREAQPGAAADPRGPAVLRPDEVRVALPLESIRACAAFAQGESGREVLQTSLREMAATSANRVEGLHDRNRRAIQMTEEQAEEMARNTIMELQLYRLLTGVDTDKVEAELVEPFKIVPEDDIHRVIVEAWRDIQEGAFQKALDRLGDQQQDDQWAMLARARAYEGLGRTEDVLATYRTAASLEPISPLCALAWSRTQSIRPGPAPDAAAMDKYAKAIPEWVDDMVLTPRLFQGLSVVPDSVRVGPLDRATLQIRLRNVAPIPLGVGSGRAMNTRLFLGPNVEIGTRVRSDASVGEVFDLDRRIRLLPNGEINATIWAEAGIAGYLGDLYADQPKRVRWRALQGFEIRPDGRREPGPACLEATTDTVAREALPEARLPVATLITRFASATEAQLPALLVAARGDVAAPATSTPDPQLPELVAALVTAYPKWSPNARLLTAAMMPPSSVFPALAPLDAEIKKDADPRVAAIVIVTRTVLPEDPVLIAALSSENTRLARLAGLHRARLTAGAKTYSKAGAPIKPATK